MAHIFYCEKLKVWDPNILPDGEWEDMLPKKFNDEHVMKFEVANGANRLGQYKVWCITEHLTKAALGASWFSASRAAAVTRWSCNDEELRVGGTITDVKPGQPASNVGKMMVRNKDGTLVVIDNPSLR